MATVQEKSARLEAAQAQFTGPVRLSEPYPDAPPLWIEPDGDGRVRLWLEDASFDTVVAWLEGLSDRSRVRVIDASVDRAEIPGQVRVRLTLERG